MKPKHFCNYRFSHTITSTQIAAAFQAHSRSIGQPIAARVNPTVLPTATNWLRGAGLATIQIEGNGGTFSNEIWIASEFEETA